MKVALIAAMAERRVIGKNNQLPWYLPADLKHFKKITRGKPVVMGRKTLESIGKPLPERRNLVITSQENLPIEGVEIFHSLDAALEALKNESEIMIIGGENIFGQAIELANYLYLTFIDAAIKGDTYFPVWNEREWQEVSREKHQADEENPYNYEFVEFKRIIKL